MMNIVNQCDQENYEPLIKPVLKKAYKRMKIDKKQIVNIVLVTNEYMRELNRTYRNKDEVTDVLTFTATIEEELGDIFIAPRKALEQARGHGHTFKRELAFLVVHGFLHAIGYDHDTEEKELVMFNLQEKILDEVKIFR